MERARHPGKLATAVPGACHEVIADAGHDMVR